MGVERGSRKDLQRVKGKWVEMELENDGKRRLERGLDSSEN